MTIREFCEKHGCAPDERRELEMFLLFIRFRNEVLRLNNDCGDAPCKTICRKP